MSRENILHRVRTALGRSEGQPVAEIPRVRLQVPSVDLETRIASFTTALEALGGKALRAPDPETARIMAGETLAGRSAISINGPFLDRCGIHSLVGVRTGVTSRAELRDLCATCEVGVTSADYALADTGSVVLLAGAHQARLVSLLPPAYLAIVPLERLLTGLDELFTLQPDPAGNSSSMVIITGPSRTADIEQILIRGVHGPGEVTVILVG